MRVLLHEINIRTGRLSKAECSSLRGWAPSNQLKDWTDKRKRLILPLMGGSFLLLDYIGLRHCFFSLPLDLNWNFSSSGVLSLQAFGLEWYHWLSWFSSLSIADLGTCQPLWLCEPISCSTSLYLYHLYHLYFCLCLCLCIYIYICIYIWRTLIQQVILVFHLRSYIKCPYLIFLFKYEKHPFKERY